MVYLNCKSSPLTPLAVILECLSITFRRVQRLQRGLQWASQVVLGVHDPPANAGYARDASST